jgi:hypothetical protein
MKMKTGSIELPMDEAWATFGRRLAPSRSLLFVL